MKIGKLTSFGHNVADSLASGICFMVGIYSTDIFQEAAASTEGYIAVDFIAGSTSGSPVSPDLSHAIQRFSESLPELAKQHGLDPLKIKVVSARFGTDAVLGHHYRVTVESTDGRRSVDQYVGVPGKRFGRPQRSVVTQEPDPTKHLASQPNYACMDSSYK
jgi:hypothetical protein